MVATMTDIERLTKERDRERKHVARLMRENDALRKRAEAAEARVRASARGEMVDGRIAKTDDEFLNRIEASGRRIESRLRTLSTRPRDEATQETPQ